MEPQGSRHFSVLMLSGIIVVGFRHTVLVGFGVIDTPQSDLYLFFFRAVTAVVDKFTKLLVQCAFFICIYISTKPYFWKRL